MTTLFGKVWTSLIIVWRYWWGNYKVGSLKLVLICEPKKVSNTTVSCLSLKLYLFVDFWKVTFCSLNFIARESIYILYLPCPKKSTKIIWLSINLLLFLIQWLKSPWSPKITKMPLYYCWVNLKKKIFDAHDMNITEISLFTNI